MARDYKGTKWIKGIIKKLIGNVMYIIEMQNGISWKRQIDQIIEDKTEEKSNAIEELWEIKVDGNIESEEGITKDEEIKKKSSEDDKLEKEKIEDIGKEIEVVNRYPTRIRNPNFKYIYLCLIMFKYTML